MRASNYLEATKIYNMVKYWSTRVADLPQIIESPNVDSLGQLFFIQR